MAIFTMEGE